MDRWTSATIQCAGGLVLNVDALTQGTSLPGSARVLQNFESSIDGGYRKINGYLKYDEDVVPGDTSEPVLGVKVALGGVYAVRKIGTDNAVYFSTGSGWGTLLNATPRTGGVQKARFISYAYSEPVVVLCDGFNPAWKHNGATEVLINGVGAPTDPKYAAVFRERLVLAGYSANYSAFSLSAAGDDEDFTGGGGAIEINVGDKIVGIKNFREVLYIFCENSIRKLSGTSAANFVLDDVSLNIGCVSADTIQEIGGDLIYLSPDGFRSLAGTERVNDIELGLVSTQIQAILLPILGQGLGDFRFSTCVVHKKSQYRFFLNDSGSTEESSIGIIGKYEGRARVANSNNSTALTYEWSTMRGIKPYCADSAFQNNQEYVVMGHPTSGLVHRLEQGSTFDGTSFAAVYRTPDITFAGRDGNTNSPVDASTRKVFQKLAIYSQVEGDVAFTAALKLDRDASDVLQPAAMGISQVGALPVYGTAIYGTDTYGELAYPVFYSNLIGSGFTGAFVYTCVDDSAPFRIDSFQVTIANKGRR